MNPVREDRPSAPVRTSEGGEEEGEATPRDAIRGLSRPPVAGDGSSGISWGWKRGRSGAAALARGRGGEGGDPAAFPVLPPLGFSVQNL